MVDHELVKFDNFLFDNYTEIMVPTIKEVKALNNISTIKEEKIFNYMTILSIVTLFSSSVEIGSLLFAVSGYLYPPHYKFLLPHSS